MSGNLNSRTPHSLGEPFLEMLGSRGGDLVGGESVKSRGAGGWRGNERAGCVTESEETAAGLRVHCACTGH